MDLKQLRYFVAVAEELHFGRAAQRLFISQPALSFDIRKFEERLGVQLLARTNKMVALTNAGQVLLDEARKLLQQAAEVERMTQRSAHGLAGRLRIGFVNSMLYRGLPRAVERFEADHPAVEIILREMNTSEQVHAIADRPGLCVLGQLPRRGRLRADLLRALRLLPAGGPRPRPPQAHRPGGAGTGAVHPVPAHGVAALSRPDHRAVCGCRLQPSDPPRGAAMADGGDDGGVRYGCGAGAEDDAARGGCARQLCTAGG
jgi:DNA-binding transcriptional LysR family regulator